MPRFSRAPLSPPLDRYRHPKTRSRLLSVSFFLLFPSIPSRELSRFNPKSPSCGSDRFREQCLRKFSLLFRATTGYAGRVMEFVAQVGCTKHRLVKNRLRWITAVPSLLPLYLLSLIPPETATPLSNSLFEPSVKSTKPPISFLIALLHFSSKRDRELAIRRKDH